MTREKDVVGGCYRNATDSSLGCRNVYPGPIVITLLVAAAGLISSYCGPDILLGSKANSTAYPAGAGMLEAPLGLQAVFLALQTYRFFNGLARLLTHENPDPSLFTRRSKQDKCNIFWLGLLRTLFHEIPSVFVFGFLLLPNQLAATVCLGIFLFLLQSVRSAFLFRHSAFAMVPRLKASAAADLMQLVPHQDAGYQGLAAVRSFNLFGCVPAIIAGLTTLDSSDSMSMNTTSTGSISIGNYRCELSCLLIGMSLVFIPQLSLLANTLWRCIRGNHPHQAINRYGVRHLLGQMTDLLNAASVSPAVCSALRSLHALLGPGSIPLVESDSYMDFCKALTVIASCSTYLTYGADTGYQHNLTRNDRTTTITLLETGAQPAAPETNNQTEGYRPPTYTDPQTS